MNPLPDSVKFPAIPPCAMARFSLLVSLHRVGSSMVEQRPFKPLVAGSSPARPTFSNKVGRFHGGPGDILKAHVAELADAQDSGSCGATRGGSSPLVSTIFFCGSRFFFPKIMALRFPLRIQNP
jgi:hypothetical protein